MINHNHLLRNAPLHSFILLVMAQLSKAVKGKSMATSGFILLKNSREKSITYSIISVLLVLCSTAYIVRKTTNTA